MAVKLFHIYDSHTEVRGRRYSNKRCCCYLLSAQLIVVVAALLQHLISYVEHRTIFHCNFNSTGIETLYYGCDIIIYDYGLFHSLWGLPVCVAQHLDGGYGRCCWCFGHIAAIFSFLLASAQYKLDGTEIEPVASVEGVFWTSHRPLWPMIVVQSTYGIGFLILSLAGLPRLVGLLNDDQNLGPLALPVSIYLAGAAVNYYLLYVIWHWYWHVEAVYKNSGSKANPTSRRTLAGRRQQRQSPPDSLETKSRRRTPVERKTTPTPTITVIGVDDEPHGEVRLPFVVQ